jgi:hypothetical protein
VEQTGSALDGACPAMEGTSGLAERVVLRGTTLEAALGGGHRVSGASSGMLGKHGKRRTTTVSRRRRGLLPATSRACDKRCPGRSGWGEAPVVSDCDWRGRGKLWGDTHPSLGPWPVNSRLAAPSSRASERKALADWNKRSHPREELCRWATIWTVRGVRTIRNPVVLADRFGCRSRQAARGPSRPWVKSPRTKSMGLAGSCESIEPAK